MELGWDSDTFGLPLNFPKLCWTIKAFVALSKVLGLMITLPPSTHTLPFFIHMVKIQGWSYWLQWHRSLHPWLQAPDHYGLTKDSDSLDNHFHVCKQQTAQLCFESWQILAFSTQMPVMDLLIRVLLAAMACDVCTDNLICKISKVFWWHKCKFSTCRPCGVLCRVKHPSCIALGALNCALEYLDSGWTHNTT